MLSHYYTLYTVAEAVHHINSVVEEPDGDMLTALKEPDGDMLTALKDPSLAMRSVTDECAQTYHQKLAAATATKQQELGECDCCVYVTLTVQWSL